MLEDFAGMQGMGRSHHYFICPECGQAFREVDGRPAPASLTDDGHSEYQLLCPECELLDQQGDQQVLPVEDVR